MSLIRCLMQKAALHSPPQAYSTLCKSASFALQPIGMLCLFGSNDVAEPQLSLFWDISLNTHYVHTYAQTLTYRHHTCTPCQERRLCNVTQSCCVRVALLKPKAISCMSLPIICQCVCPRPKQARCPPQGSIT